MGVSSTKRMVARIFPLLSLWVLIPASMIAGADAPTLYYARFSIASRNGVIVESKLEMRPTDTEYRMDGFERIQAVGIADPSAGLDIASAAKHDAITRILTIHGLKSISATGWMLNALSDDRVQMNYEGVIRYPLRIVEERFEDGLYRSDLEVDFSPLSFPDRWSYLAVKYQFRETVRWLMHLFI